MISIGNSHRRVFSDDSHGRGWSLEMTGEVNLPDDLILSISVLNPCHHVFFRAVPPYLPYLIF